ncbi:MAG TPA: hypothetical protein EYQ57_08385 [Methylococcaceae bacterium]|nr:hypothetical protein [Methylococcaceae bacterium]
MNEKQIRAHWEVILKLAASIQPGTVSASLSLIATPRLSLRLLETINLSRADNGRLQLDL